MRLKIIIRYFHYLKIDITLSLAEIFLVSNMH